MADNEIADGVTKKAYLPGVKTYFGSVFLVSSAAPMSEDGEWEPGVCEGVGLGRAEWILGIDIAWRRARGGRKADGGSGEEKGEKERRKRGENEKYQCTIYVDHLE